VQKYNIMWNEYKLIAKKYDFCHIPDHLGCRSYKL